jgi:ActR/RegA family two-component response regulator
MAAVNDGIVCSHSYDTPNVSETARRLELKRSILSKHFSGRTGHQNRADKNQ